MKKIKKENKFFVLKQADIEEFFEQFRQGMFLNREGERLSNAFNKIVKGIQDMREEDGRPRFNNYVVVNQDEPYAEMVWQLILMGEKAKEYDKRKKDAKK
jgi:hypothetical protein